MFGQSDIAADDDGGESISDADKKVSFHYKKLGQKAAIVARSFQGVKIVKADRHDDGRDIKPHGAGKEAGHGRAKAEDHERQVREVLLAYEQQDKHDGEGKTSRPQ